MINQTKDKQKTLEEARALEKKYKEELAKQNVNQKEIEGVRQSRW